MEQAIHHADGNMISSGEWAAIKAMARVIKMDLLSLPTPTSRHAKDQKKTKMYFRTFFHKEWANAITKMESQQPLLALCAAHWKADHVLGNTLLVTPATNSVDSDDSGSISINAAPSQLSKHKKKSSNDLEAHKRKKQKMEKTVTSKKTEDRRRKWCVASHSYEYHHTNIHSRAHSYGIHKYG